jgi:hypothetical protein
MIVRTEEQKKATKICEKYLCTTDQFSPLRNWGFTHAHTTTYLPGCLCQKYFLNSHVQ